MITLARPELHERRPSWGAGQRNFTSLYLEPLPQQAMEALLDGLVPGLPGRAARQILARAEGVPLYAVETVRMLLDRGAARPAGPGYRLAGEIETLEVPETLHALIAARLDGLSPEERRLLQDGAVLGKTFTRAGGRRALRAAENELEPLLRRSCARRCSRVQSDPRSPEHGQYGFLQDLVRHVAYETLSQASARAATSRRPSTCSERLPRRRRSPRSSPRTTWRPSTPLPTQKTPDDSRAGAEMRSRERASGRRRSEPPRRRRRYFEQAAELADEPLAEGRFARRAGVMAGYSGDPTAMHAPREAIETFEAEGDAHGAARASGRLGRRPGSRRRDEAVARLERAFEVISADEPDQDLAMIARRSLGRTGSAAISSWPPSGPSSRSTSPRRSGCRRHSCSRSGPRPPSRTAGVTEEEAFACCSHALDLSLEHELSDDAGPSTSSFRTCFRATATPRRSPTSTNRSPSRKAATGPRVGRPRRADLSAEDARALGRGAGDRDEFTEEQVDAGGVAAQPAGVGDRSLRARGELDEARGCTRCSRFWRLDRPAGPRTWLRPRPRSGRGRAGYEEASRPARHDRRSRRPRDHLPGHEARRRRRDRVGADAREHGRRTSSCLRRRSPLGGRPPFLEAQTRASAPGWRRTPPALKPRHSVSAARGAVPARRHSARARGADRQWGVARRGARDLPTARRRPLARTCRGRSSAAGAGTRLDD